MAITYNELAEELQGLEKKFGGNSTQSYSGSAKSAIRPTDNFQCFALDTTTSSGNLELPVVIAVGANYCDGKTALPSGKSKGVLKNFPWIEYNLNGERVRFEGFLCPARKGNVVIDHIPCKPGYAKELWEPENGKFKIFTNAGQRGDDLWRSGPIPTPPPWNQLPESYHLVMTNFCPLVTYNAWSYYRDYNPSISQELFSFGLSLGHLMALQNALGKQTKLWLGHGHFDVYHHFYTYLVRGYQPGFTALTKNQWAFTSNSGFSPSQKTVCPRPNQSL